MKIEPGLGEFRLEKVLSAGEKPRGWNLGLLVRSLQRKRKQREMSAEMKKETF